MRHPDVYKRQLLVVGIMTQISLQTFLHIAVVSGLVPATGISLPFFSYGGTALALSLIHISYAPCRIWWACPPVRPMLR